MKLLKCKKKIANTDENCPRHCMRSCEDKGGGMMERFTTNKDVSEMGMYELAHNNCYYKDGKARYRDFESDIDSRELTRSLLKNFADSDDSFVDDEDFDEEMLDLLQYGTETIEGLIALFYRNLWSMADLREKLKEYEDAEEQGLLLRLPCKVGDTIYHIWNVDDNLEIQEIKIATLTNLVAHLENGNFGKYIFLTKAEAEQKLKEMESD